MISHVVKFEKVQYNNVNTFQNVKKNYFGQVYTKIIIDIGDHNY